MEERSKYLGLDSVQELRPEQVQPITFIGSAVGSSGGSEALGAYVKEQMEGSGLEHLTEKLTFAEWSEHSQLASIIGELELKSRPYIWSVYTAASASSQINIDAV